MTRSATLRVRHLFGALASLCAFAPLTAYGQAPAQAPAAPRAQAPATIAPPPATPAAPAPTAPAATPPRQAPAAAAPVAAAPARPASATAIAPAAAATDPAAAGTSPEQPATPPTSATGTELSGTPESTSAPPAQAPSGEPGAANAAQASPSVEAGAPSTEATDAIPLDDSGSTGLSEGDSDDHRINFYGFADVTFNKDFRNKVTGFGSRYSTFAVGNLNLYMGSELGDNWRSLVEVRFTYLPHGQIPYNEQYVADPKRFDATAQDYTDTNRPLQWGAIAIQRAQIERTFHEALTLRAGHFLSPYGIWNVDHGSPVIIGVRRPYLVGEGFIPQSQTGLEAFGSFYYRATQFGYHLTLSNGRGPIDTYKDLDHNKAIGGRLFVRTEGDFGQLQFGLSGFRGRYTNRTQSFAMVDNTPVISDPALLEYSEASLTTDVKWEFHGLLVQSEAGMNDRAYAAARASDAAFLGGPAGFVPDHRRVAFYTLLGYRTPWWNAMPFFGYEYMRVGRQELAPVLASAWGGLNVRPTPRVVLKAQLSWIYFPEKSQLPGATETPGFGKFETQIAWSF
ncbi:MAG TPA: hypothetical protein VKP30_08705 [Polyangiaceae bacterium]|nr:hypothetical protein [Polyangiaceae bacterium]